MVLDIIISCIKYLFSEIYILKVNALNKNCISIRNNSQHYTIVRVINCCRLNTNYHNYREDSHSLTVNENRIDDCGLD